jgi:hypothetical protein
MEPRREVREKRVGWEAVVVAEELVEWAVLLEERLEERIERARFLLGVEGEVSLGGDKRGDVVVGGGDGVCGCYHCEKRLPSVLRRDMVVWVWVWDAGYGWVVPASKQTLT